jgi:hypothetical protein
MYHVPAGVATPARLVSDAGVYRAMMPHWGVLVAGLLLGVVPAGGVPPGGRPIVLRITGRLAPTHAAAAGTIAALALEVRGEPGPVRRWLGVTDARTLPRGDPIAGQDLVQALLPLGGRLRVSGPPALLARLRRAPVGSEVTLEGMGFSGDRNLLLTRVDVTPPPAP